LDINYHSLRRKRYRAVEMQQCCHRKREKSGLRNRNQPEGLPRIASASAALKNLILIAVMMVSVNSDCPAPRRENSIDGFLARDVR
jgi:hypothetical protein